MNGNGHIVSPELLEKRLEAVIRHIDGVRGDGLILGRRMIEAGEAEDGLSVICNTQKHDNSKLKPGSIEWSYLHPDVAETNEIAFKLAWQQHVSTNPHHPEYWPGGIEEMPRMYLAEMVCDWHTRSSEFGTDLREWVKDKACPKYKISCSGKTYKEIKELMDMLLDRSFK